MNEKLVDNSCQQFVLLKNISCPQEKLNKNQCIFNRINPYPQIHRTYYYYY
jgi:hypothetical protein